MGQLDKDQLAAGSVQLWSPRRALSGAKAPSLFLARSCKQASKQARSETHTHTHGYTSRRVGLAEISWMTLGRENDALSSSHPGPSSLNSPSGSTPGYPSPSGQPRPTMWHPIIPARRRPAVGAGEGAAAPPGSQPQMSQQWASGSSEELLLKKATATAGFRLNHGLVPRFLLAIRFRLSDCQFVFFFPPPDAVAGIIWLMTAEFPYLITNRIWAPLELLGEESDEWQGRAQWPERGEGQDSLVSETGWGVKKIKKRERERLGDGKRMTMSYLFLPLPLRCSCRVFLFFPLTFLGSKSWKQKRIPALEIGRCLLVGQLIIFSLPVMKVATGVSALGDGWRRALGCLSPSRPSATRVLLGL